MGISVGDTGALRLDRVLRKWNSWIKKKFLEN